MPSSSLDESEAREATVWLGVGIVGVLLFAAGIYRPALASLPDSPYIEVVLAIAGGATAVYGFTNYYDERIAEVKRPRRRPLKGRARQIAIAPSLEVYDPRVASPVHVAEEPGPPPQGPSTGG